MLLIAVLQTKSRSVLFPFCEAARAGLCPACSLSLPDTPPSLRLVPLPLGAILAGLAHTSGHQSCADQSDGGEGKKSLDTWHLPICRV